MRSIENQKKRLEILVDEQTKEIKEGEAQLIHSVKMSALGKITASMAHEINNPVGTIISNADIQLRCLDKLAEARNSEDHAENEKLLRILRTNSEADTTKSLNGSSSPGSSSLEVPGQNILHTQQNAKLITEEHRFFIHKAYGIAERVSGIE